jgi:Fe-S cluster biogenesis protein NfuA
LQEHGGYVELVKISPPDRVSIRLVGACDGCGSSKVTLTEGVEKSLRSHCDWLVHIDDVSERKKAPVKPGESQPIHFISPFSAASK